MSGTIVRFGELALAAAVLTAAASACGSTRTSHKQTAYHTIRPTAARVHGNQDGDGDEDDTGAEIRLFGRRASLADTRSITVLMKEYYSAAARRDGARACKLLYSPIERSAPTSYGKFGPRYLHGASTCGAVLSLVFQHEGDERHNDYSSLEVMGVRVSGVYGYALLRFRKTMLERQMPIERERGAWKVNSLIDSELP